jgi:hypothetical protein
LIGITERAQLATSETVWQREGVTAEHIDVLVTEGRQTCDILVEHLEAFVAQLVQGGIHVDRVPQYDGVEDQAERAELILLPLAVALSQLGSSQNLPEIAR